MLKNLRAVLKDRALRLPGLDVKADYISSLPFAQNSLDIFKGEWASRMPPSYQNPNAGNAGLFEDGRIIWLGERLGKLDQMLECGPIEGGLQSAASAKYEGFKHSLHRQHYQASRSDSRFTGCSSHNSHWLTRDDHTLP
jgi:hypothetical protein